MKWHHRPAHAFEPHTMYIVTAGTLNKEHYFKSAARLKILQECIFNSTMEFSWQLQSWAIFSNHYHIIAKSPDKPETLSKMIQKIHSISAIQVNKHDNTSGRKIWFEYWDTCLTYEKSYLARLNYVNNNPVHHGIVGLASEYEFFSAAWFETNTDPTFRNKVQTFASDEIKINDDY